MIQYSKGANPYSIRGGIGITSDVVMVKFGQHGGGSGWNASTTGSSPKGYLGVDFSPRPAVNSSVDECTTVYSTTASGEAGMASTLKGACTKWNTTTRTFSSLNGCRLDGASHNSSNEQWSFQCACPVDEDEMTTFGTIMAMSLYTFDRFGRVFRPGLVIEPSIAPLIMATIPFVFAAMVLAVIKMYLWSRARYRRAKDRRTTHSPAPTFDNNQVNVVNPLNAAARGRVQARQRRSVERLRRQSVTNLEEVAAAGSGSLRFFRHFFRVESSGADANEATNEAANEAENEAEENAKTCCVSKKCLRYSWRRWWTSTKGAHELLAIFTGRRRPGMGLNERMVIFVGCVYSNMLGGTLMFHQYVV